MGTLDIYPGGHVKFCDPVVPIVPYWTRCKQMA
jgi:hypothetical protein